MIPRLPPQIDDGVVASKHARGWLGDRWAEIALPTDPKHAARIARGRSLANRGRVVQPWFSPGIAAGDVIDGETFRTTIRVRPFDEATWDRIREVLLADLRLIASLIEGRLDKDLIATLERAGVKLLPTRKELGGDCDCGDFMVPCPHMTALHLVLADALDGVPLLLFELRGRTREQLLADLSRAWGDDRPMQWTLEQTEDSPPDGDWYSDGDALAAMTFRMRAVANAATGLQALGPPPGEAELFRALEPLYEAGSRAAEALALAEDVEETARRRARGRPRKPQPERAWRVSERYDVGDSPDDLDDEEDAPMDAAAEIDTNLTQRIVEILSTLESAKSKDVADRLGADPNRVRQELIALEEIGVVYRTGKTRGTRWWLG